MGILRAWIDEIHPHPYRLHTREEFDEAVVTLSERIELLPEHVAALELQRLLAMVGDGHTELAALPPSLRGPGLRLVIRRFAEGWFVTTGHLDHAGLFGRPIVSIGGLEVDEVVRRLTPYVSADNAVGALDGVGNLMRNGRVLESIGLRVGAGESIDFVVLGTDGRRRSVPVAVVSEVRFGDDWVDAEKYLRPDMPEPLFRALDGNYACRHLPDEGAVYVLFSEVRDEEEGESMAEFFPRVLDFAETSEADRLVLDLRENSGGNLDLNGPVIRGIIRSRFDRPGSLFVLIGDDTYSAAMHLAVTLERLAHPIFVGVPTESRPNHWGDTRELVLPVSDILIEISELFWQQSDPRDVRPWITPDIPATPTMGDRLLGRDGVLGAALRYRMSENEENSFGTPLGRWKRSNQSTEEVWPDLLEPSARPVRMDATEEPRRGHGVTVPCESR